MFSQSVPGFVKYLSNLSTMLDKTAQFCADTKVDPAVLMTSRLYPNMLPFTRQIQIASDTAKGAAARLAGVEVPKFEDTETTIDELKARIAKTIAFIQSLSEAQFADGETRTFSLKFPSGEMSFVGLPYLNTFALPNFYFHATTAYDILRHNGVPLGKADYLGSLT